MLKKMHIELRELQCVLGILGRRRSLPGKANPSLPPLEYHEAGSWFTHLRGVMSGRKSEKDRPSFAAMLKAAH